MQYQGHGRTGRCRMETAFETAFGTGENDFRHGGSRMEGGRKLAGAYIGAKQTIAIGR